MAMTNIIYNGEEISSVDESTPFSITCGSLVDIEAGEGDAITLSCSGKYMPANIVVGSVTLNCVDKIMASDVSIEIASPIVETETWYWNTTVSISESTSYDVSFTTGDGSHFIGITTTTGPKAMFNRIYYGSSSVSVYSGSSGWNDSVFRTIILDEPATGDLLAFLQANATKV